MLWFEPRKETNGEERRASRLGEINGAWSLRSSTLGKGSFVRSSSQTEFGA
jgi:hypothetical protein